MNWLAIREINNNNKKKTEIDSTYCAALTSTNFYQNFILFLFFFSPILRINQLNNRWNSRVEYKATKQKKQTVVEQNRINKR